MKKNKKQLVTTSLIVIAILLFIGLTLPSLLKSLKFGLDLQGGFEVLYQVDSIDGEEVTDAMVTNTYKTMLKRIDSLGVLEPEVTVEGDKIRVQLAGVTDIAEAREILSQAANLTFRDTSDKLIMNSDVLVSGGASIGQDSSGGPAISLGVSDKTTFYEKTKYISGLDDNRIVIWLDFDSEEDSFKTEVDASGNTTCGTTSARCLSVATVSKGFASDVIIQGTFTTEEVSNLVDLINSGSLPTKLTEISSKSVKASFGQDSLIKTASAGVVALVIILALLIIIYRFAGAVASVGLIIYTYLTFVLFWLVGGVLTLPGIAAMVLGMGMAIDSNIINFSRIKDELEVGRDFRSAYKKGNSNSLLTIIDANLTTLLVAVILFILGESSVKGFATMLIISILITMLVMVVMSRLFLNSFVKTGYFDKNLNFFIGIKNLKKKRFAKLEFVKSSKIFIAISAICIVAGFVSLGFSGLKLGVDFKGGSSITIKSDDSLTVETVEADVDTLGYTLISSEQIDDSSVSVLIEENLEGATLTSVQDHFDSTYSASTDIGVVTNVVKQELIKNAILAVILASIGIIIYMTLRYKFSYAIGGVVALFHDAFIIIALFSILKLEVSSIFVAAILTIIGYSINDTIVIFDRIKENVTNEYDNKITSKQQLVDVVNSSLRQTIIRSIITTLATLIPVILLIVMGSHEILMFNIALLFGLVAGSYSSIFIASQIWLFVESKKIGKQPKKKWYEDIE